LKAVHVPDDTVVELLEDLADEREGSSKLSGKEIGRSRLIVWGLLLLNFHASEGCGCPGRDRFQRMPRARSVQRTAIQKGDSRSGAGTSGKRGKRPVVCFTESIHYPGIHKAPAFSTWVWAGRRTSPVPWREQTRAACAASARPMERGRRISFSRRETRPSREVSMRPCPSARNRGRVQKILYALRPAQKADKPPIFVRRLSTYDLALEPAAYSKQRIRAAVTDTASSVMLPSSNFIRPGTMKRSANFRGYEPKVGT